MSIPGNPPDASGNWVYSQTKGHWVMKDGSPITLDDVRKKYPNANHAPRAGCRYCGGSGERRTDKRKFTILSPPDFLPCICLYVDHDMADVAAESLATTARKCRDQ